MKGISKLKDEARKLEQREEWDKAIKLYLEVLAAADEAGGGESELPLYNRVGDLYVRVGRQHDAVRYYEQAADRYAEAGLFNNAIALCNKALRYVPGRLGVLRRLGQYSASQGFLTDARSYFMQYAEKAFAEGETDAALTALRDYANISGDAGIRELLGHKLHAEGKAEEGLAELKRAYAMRLGAGETEAAASTRREILSLDPSAFDDEQAGGTVPLPPQPPVLPARAAELPDLPDAPPAEPPIQSVAASFAADIGATGIDELEPESGSAPALLEGFESTALESEAAGDTDLEALSGLEPARDFDPAFVELPRLEGLEAPEPEPELPATLPPLELADEALGRELEGDVAPDVPSLELPLLDDVDAEPLPLLNELEAEGMAELSTLPELDQLDQALASPLPELEQLDQELASPLPELEQLDEELASPLPELDQLDQELASPLPELDQLDEEPALPLPELPDLPELEAPEDASPLPGLDESERPGNAPLPTSAGELETLPHEAPLPLLEEDQQPAAALPLPTLEEEPADDPTPLPLLTDDVLAPGGYVDLRSLVVEPEPARADTRFTVEEQGPTGDEDDDFAQLLTQFKQKVADNVSPEDAAAHYDLGLAFKDMGLLDEAISELQIALHAGDMRLKVFEELGLCFLLKREFSIAEKVLRRALETRYDDELELLGVYYHLGRAYEELGKPDMARDAYERVLSLDINFGDVSDRIARL